MSETLDEFKIIRSFFDLPALTHSTDFEDPFFELQIGDDCALIQPSPGKQLAISVDTLVAGVHFLVHSSAAKIAWRALAVSVSDLAAMGATPKAFTLALTLPDSNRYWLQLFSEGLAAAAQHYGIRLVGGDTTKGPLAISIQVFGEVDAGKALRRDAAHVDDVLFVSGSLGGAHLALNCLNKTHLTEAQLRLQEAYFCPDSCIHLGMSLIDLAHACVDVSDGLVADAEHIANRSNVRLEIDASKVPFNPAGGLFTHRERLQAALIGGDDYQLCFSAPASVRDTIQTLAQSLGIDITEIGRVTEGCGVDVINAGFDLEHTGYNHF